jgi:hypothetical protein
MHACAYLPEDGPIKAILYLFRKPDSVFSVEACTTTRSGQRSMKLDLAQFINAEDRLSLVADGAQIFPSFDD